MHLDGLTIAALAAELHRSIVGSRIQKIYHPRPSVVTLELWAGQEQLLLIETEEDPRIHLTQQRFVNPPQPSAFCMLLRKYLRNGVISGVGQPGLERILDLYIREEYILRTELLGKQTNIVLVRNGTILGAIKSTVGQRSFRPGEVYQAPPAQEKLDPRTMTQEEFFARLSVLSAPSPKGKGDQAPPGPFVLPPAAARCTVQTKSGRGGAGGEVREGGEGALEIAQALLQIIDGIGPRLAKEIALRAQLDPGHPVALLSSKQRAALWEATRQLFDSALHHPSPHLYFDGDVPVDVAPIPLKLYEHLRGESRPTLSQALDELCSSPTHTVDQEKLALQKAVRQHLAKTRIALERVTQDFEKTKDYERLKHEGQLLITHLSHIQSGAAVVELEDFLDGTRKTITLDPALSPLENAQRKFERYKKLKRAYEKLAARAEELRQELEYLEGVASSLERAESPEDLAKLREELQARGYLPRQPQAEQPTSKGGPREFLIRGYRVLVGRSSTENDELVRSASREDYWLHARDRPGSHVIVKNPTQREVPRDVLEQAAQLAAYYSKGRDAKKVPVSYTRVKYLRKGGRPGLVFMTYEEGTLLVPPKGEV